MTDHSALDSYRGLTSQQPSLTAFRSICKQLEADVERDDFEQILAFVTDAVVAWPYTARHAPWYWIQRFVDGQLPTALLAVVGGIQLLPVFLTDDLQRRPMEQFDARAEALGTWIDSIPADAPRLTVELVDLSTQALDDRLEYGLQLYDQEALFKRILASGWLGGTRALNLSIGAFDDDSIGNHDSYLHAEEAQSSFPSISLKSIGGSPCAPTLEMLSLAGTSVGGRVPKSGFPNLRVVDLSYGLDGHQRNSQAVRQFTGGQAPKLEELHLRTNGLIDLACSHVEEPVELDDEAVMYLEHDYCLSPEQLSGVVFSAQTLRYIVKAKHTPKLQLIDLGREYDRALEVCASLDDDRLGTLTRLAMDRPGGLVERDPSLVVDLT